MTVDADGPVYRHMGDYLKKEHKGKIAIVTGARQTGKTYLCNHETPPDVTLNLDLPADRKTFRNFQYSPSGPPKGILFVDEIHKMKGWRPLVKGYFDKYKNTDYIISGSSAFELLKNDKGDSLAGRTLTIRLEPVTFREFLVTRLRGEGTLPMVLDFASDLARQLGNFVSPGAHKVHWDRYYSLGGFPEPLSKDSEEYLSGWLREYMNALLTRDIRDLESAKDAERVEQTFLLLLNSVGSVYSLRSMAETLSCSPNTIKSDILVLRKVLWGFELPACLKRISSQIRRGKKFYPVDWSLTRYSDEVSPGAVFETAIVDLLHRHLTYANLKRIRPLRMTYFQNYQKEEIDAVIQDGARILLAVEAKLKAKSDDLSKFARLCRQINAPIGIMVTAERGVFAKFDNTVYCISASDFASMLW